MFNQTALFATARNIAAHKAEEGIPTEGSFRGYDAEQIVAGDYTATDILSGYLNQAIKGEINPRSATTWAAIVDAQEAAKLLDKAEQAEQTRAHFAAADYRAAAERKLAEAASWLF